MNKTTSDATFGNRRLCFECVLEPLLREKIEKDGLHGTCSYCQQDEKTLSINQIADSVQSIFTQFYRLIESPSLEDQPIAPVSVDQPVTQVIQDLVEATEMIAEDIRCVLAEREAAEDGDGSKDDSFNPEKRYVKEPRLDSWEFDYNWRRFEKSLKNETRYFNRSAEDLLTSIFVGIEEHRAINGRPIIVEAGPGNDFVKLYQARVFQTEKSFREAMKQPDVGVGPPPRSAAAAGRMNAAGISVFYGATRATIALAEVRPPVGSKVLIGCFEVIQPLKLLDLVALTDLADEEGSLFDDGHIHRLRRAEFLRGLSRRLSKPVMPNDQPLDYLPTQAIADFLATAATPPLDGIIYPSVQNASHERARRKYGFFGPRRDHACNVVLFHRASRVQVLDKGAEISVFDDSFLFQDSETFEMIPDVQYTVWVRPPENPDATDDALLKFKSLEAYCVSGVKIDTEPIRTSRFLREEREPDSLSIR